MKDNLKRNLKLGAFIIVGLVIFIAVVYYLGSQQNLFGSSIKVSAVFGNVSGLQEGNNVRYAGINVGTVENIEIISDSTVRVSMVIKEEAGKYIKDDATVTIESAGLMGNKIVTISSGSPNADFIQHDDELITQEPINIDEVLKTVQTTSQYARRFTSNLAEISKLIIDGEGLAGTLLADSSMGERVENIVARFEQTSRQTVDISREINSVTTQLAQGKGTLGSLIQDDSMITFMRHTLDSLSMASANAVEITRKLSEFSSKLNNDKGSIGRILTDTAMAAELEKTIGNVNQAAQEIDVTAEKVNNSWLLNGLFGGSKDKDKKK